MSVTRLIICLGAGMCVLSGLASCNMATNQNKPLYGIYLCGDSPDGRLRIIDDTLIVGGLTEDFPANYTYDAGTHTLNLTPDPSAPDARPELWLHANKRIFELRYVPGGVTEAGHAGPGLIASGEEMTHLDEGGFPVDDPYSDLWCPYRG